MKDQYGRTIDYIRISVTDRCNLRCVYCMPEEGVEQVAHEEILTYQEIVRIARLCARMGISKVKLTGGEPLVRKGLYSLVRDLKRCEGIEQVTLTTNGVELKSQMEELAKAGLDAVNISLDTLDAGMYASVTRRDMLDQALEGLKEALRYPQVKVKINCVPMRNVNEGQWTTLAGLSRDLPVDVRFIEMMPIGLGKEFQGRRQDDSLAALRKDYGQETLFYGKCGNGPSIYVKFPGFKGRIGFISAISHKFCGECNRIRLTSEGFLKPCLQYENGTDIKGPLRRGQSDEELAMLIEDAIYRKPRSHHFEQAEGEGFEQRQMSKIGG